MESRPDHRPQHSAEREKIWRYSLDGKTKTLFASGTRNTEKLQFLPGTQEVWGLDHGSDWWGLLLGDNKTGQAPSLIPFRGKK